MTTTAHTTTLDTKLGPFTTVVDEDGAVIASGWTSDTAELLRTVAPSLRPTATRRRRDLGAVTTAVRDYHAGDIAAIDTVTVRQSSGEFLEHAWQLLRTIPAGSPATYTEFAALAGNPKATRAAANACARNAVALFVPCHRIVRAGTGPLATRLGGFRWGLDVKRRLLDHEGATAASDR